MEPADLVHTGNQSLALFDTREHADTLAAMGSPELHTDTGAVLSANGVRSVGVADLPVEAPGWAYTHPLHAVTYNSITGALWLKVSTTDTIVRPGLMALRNGTVEVLLDVAVPFSSGTKSVAGMVYLPLDMFPSGDVYLDMGGSAILHGSGLTLPVRNIPMSVFDGLSPA